MSAFSLDDRTGARLPCPPETVRAEFSDSLGRAVARRSTGSRYSSENLRWERRRAHPSPKSDSQANPHAKALRNAFRPASRETIGPRWSLTENTRPRLSRSTVKVSPLRASSPRRKQRFAAQRPRCSSNKNTKPVVRPLLLFTSNTPVVVDNGPKGVASQALAAQNKAGRRNTGVRACSKPLLPTLTGMAIW